MRERWWRAGVTVLELLVVVAVVGITTGGSVLVLPAIVGAVRLETALHQVAAELRQARTLAVASARRVRLVLHTGGTGYVRELAGRDGYRRDRTGALPPGIAVARVGSQGTLTFSPLGTAENATIVLESSTGARRALVLNQRGRVDVDRRR